MADNNTEKSSLKITELSQAANINYLTQKNCKIQKNGDFIGAAITLTDGEPLRTVDHRRIWLHRAFPFDMPYEFISVQNKDGEELGLIRSLDDFDGEDKKLLKDELCRKYYTPKIEKILSLKETRGASFWKCKTDAGELEFTLQDTYKSISRIGSDRAFITDVCGNRYEIASIAALDKSSMRKLEIYL